MEINALIKIRRIPSLIILLIIFPVLSGSAVSAADNWIQLSDGASLQHWKINENPESWSLKDSVLIANGKRSHIFYAGSDTPFVNFELQAEVFTERGSNGGIYFLTHYQDSGWPETGFEAQVNNSYFIDPKKTGSLYGIDNKWFFSPAKDETWFQYSIIVDENRVVIRVDGQIITEHLLATRPAEGTIALQAHDRRSLVKYRNVRIRRLD